MIFMSPFATFGIPNAGFVNVNDDDAAIEDSGKVLDGI